jgi:hypothetical protein
VISGLALAVLAVGYQAWGNHGTLPNRIPEPPPYNTTEAQFFPPPWEAEWEGVNNPGNCSNCHSRIFDEWNGSMMSNSWRDPGWRGAFLLISRLTATDGNCDIPNPPDGTARAQINPFANGDCTSTFNIGTTTHTTSGSGSLLDDFCSRCHMPTNYVDNVDNVILDTPSGLEHGEVNPNFDPTSDNGTGLAFATLASQFRNTDTGKRGIFCEVCHTYVETRYTPYNNYEQSGTQYVPAAGTDSRDLLVAQADQDMLDPPDATKQNLGYAIGAGAYRLSPHAIGFPERFGPLSFNDHTATLDPYVSDVFNLQFFYQQGEFSGKHDGFYSVMFDRAEYCAACHDVTNPMTIKNDLGNWVGGFPIERTYTEWANSRYGDRPTNTNFDPNFKRDCQTCHMQQHFGQPGTAQTLYASLGQPVSPLTGNPCKSGPVRPVFYSHHFIGGNAYIPRLIGADVNSQGNVEPYPELSTASYSSADETSIYHNAVWENVSATGTPTHHARMAWDRLRNVLEMDLTGPTSAGAGTTQPLTLTVSNTGSGHNFPSGFPEGRNAWVSVRAWDLATGDELMIEDSFWNRTSLGVGYLTTATSVDPNFPGCNWTTPAGSPDPFAFQFRAVASKGDGCPTLDLPYATPLNLVTNAQGLPVDSGGTVIDRNNPLGKPQFQDLDGDGDLYDDSYLLDSRLRPRPHAGSSLLLDRYSVVIPAETAGPVAVTAAVYYQSFEAIVGSKFLGNLADTDQDLALEPCTLKGLCDGRTPVHEPAVVEGAPPVPMELASWVINITGTTDATAPSATSLYPMDGAVDAFQDAVVKIQLSEPVTGVDATTFTLVDSGGLSVPAFVDQIGDGVWALAPHQIFLTERETYTARVAAPVCDLNNNCTSQDIVWSFTVARTGEGTGDTSIPLGFAANGGGPGGDTTPPTVLSVAPSDGAIDVGRNTDVVVTFSEAVMGVDAASFLLNADGGNGDCSTLGASVPGTITSNPGADVWSFDPDGNLDRGVTYCVTVTTAVQDLAGNALAQPFTSRFTTR